MAPLGLVFALLIATIVVTFNSWRLSAVAFLVCVCSLGLSLLAPWVDQTSTTLHWAWFGYVPMLVLLPEQLERLWQGGWLARWPAIASAGR